MIRSGWPLGILTIALLAITPAAVVRGQTPASDVEGTATVGAHVSDVDGTVEKVREYDLGREELQPELWLDLGGYSGDNRYDVLLHYYDEKTFGTSARIEPGPHVDTRLEHRSFVHWFGHDRLENLQWREAVLNTSGELVPGGKMVTHEDTDPLGRYGIRRSETRHDLAIQLPFLPGTRVETHYRDQMRVGHAQVLSVEHCSNCHIRSRGQALNEQIRDLTARVSTELEPVWMSYAFYTRDYDNDSQRVTNDYMVARHPVNGGSGDEFQSRLIYDGEELEIARKPDVEKMGHTVEARVDLPAAQSLEGSFRYAKTENARTGNAIRSNAANVAWFAPLSKRLRMSASVLRREIETDDVPIDLAPWRDGRPGGGQDFDTVRRSAYDREEYLATVNANYAFRPGHSLRFGYRFRSTDRSNFELDPDDASETTTVQNRVTAAWYGRLAKSARSRVAFTYEMTDHPFVNVRGICEMAQGDTLTPIGGPGTQPNDWIYYFQRQRYGTGTNQPAASLRLNANLSYAFGSKVSVNGFLNVTDDSNDDLNVYEYELTSVNPGLQLFWMPDPRAVVTLGGSMSVIESNAKMCATVMDG
jgi:hypothetical protein